MSYNGETRRTYFVYTLNKMDSNNDKTGSSDVCKGAILDSDSRWSVSYDVGSRHHRPPGLDTPFERESHKNSFVQGPGISDVREILLPDSVVASTATSNFTHRSTDLVHGHHQTERWCMNIVSARGHLQFVDSR